MIKVILRIITVLAGMWLGAIIGALVIVGKIRRRIEKRAGAEYSPTISPEDRKKLDDILRRYKRAYKLKYKHSVIGKIFGLKTKKRKLDGDADYGMGKLLTDVARVFNPQSERPLFELTGGDAFAFGHTVTEKLVGIFDASGLKFLNGITVGTVLNYVTIVDRAKKNKLVRGAEGTYKVVLNVINAINPFYWFKRTVASVVTKKICESVIFTGVEVIVKEFASFYEKTSSDYPSKEIGDGRTA